MEIGQIGFIETLESQLTECLPLVDQFLGGKSIRNIEILKIYDFDRFCRFTGQVTNLDKKFQRISILRSKTHKK